MPATVAGLAFGLECTATGTDLLATLGIRTIRGATLLAYPPWPYRKLLDKLANAKFSGAPPELQQNILAFYQDPNAPNLNKKKPDQRNRTLRNIEALRALNIENVATR